MQSLEDLGMQTWETAKEGIYFEEIFSPFYDSLFHVCAFIIREDSLTERQEEEKRPWVQRMKSKVSFGGTLIIRRATMGVLEFVTSAVPVECLAAGPPCANPLH